MRFLFVDETGDSKEKAYLGLCIASIDSTKYALLKKGALKILEKAGWPHEIEFKGSYLFSKTSGCKDVPVDERVAAAEKILELNAKKRSRIKFAYGQMQSANPNDDYLEGLPGLIYRVLPKAPQGAGKNLVLVACDDRSGIDADVLNHAVKKAVQARGYVLLERPMQVKSSTDTVGIMFADIVGYLLGRLDTIDVGKFDQLTAQQLETHGDFKKHESATKLIEKIKSLDLYVRSA
jgi:hypothetical protein